MGVWNRFVFGLLHLLLSLVGQVIFFRLGADHLTLAGGGGDFWSSRIFFLSIWWAGYFFPFFSHKLSITLLLRAIFFLPTSACRKFCFKITHSPPQELNGRLLSEAFNN